MNEIAAPPSGAPRAPLPWRRVVRHVSVAVLAVVLTVALIAFLVYRRQVISYLTHWKGGPSTTVPFEPYTERPLLHIAAVGDSGDGGDEATAVGAAIARVGADTPYEVLLLLGDLMYPSGDPTRADELVFTPFRDVLAQGAELEAILGNHDVQAGLGDEVLAALGLGDRYWARTFGEVLLIGLDSNTVDDPAQRAFLEETLATTTATWRIVAVHHPPYSAGYQGSSTNVRAAFSPIFARYGVQLVLSGHDHDYQRSRVIDGVTYVVTGGGSGLRRTGEDDFTEVAYAWVHFTDIGIFEDRLVLRAVGTDGRVADTVTITP